VTTTDQPRDVLRCAACGRIPTEASITTGLQGCPGHSEEIGCGSRCFELVTVPKPRQSSADVLFDLGVALMRAQCRTLAQPEQRA
jgi:hypothetical protein